MPIRKPYKVVYSGSFNVDVEAVTFYIARNVRTPNAAIKLLDKIIAAVNKRSCNPDSFEKFILPNGCPIFRIYIGNYVVYYTLEDDVMVLNRFLYGKRDIADIL